MSSENGKRNLGVMAGIAVAIIATVSFAWAVLDRKVDKGVYESDLKALTEKVSDVKITMDKNETKNDRSRDQVTRIAVKLGVE